MSVFSAWPYFVLVLAVLCMLALPVFRVADEPHGRDQRTATLDGLRGFLALSVFVHHLMVTHGYIVRGEWSFPPPGFPTLLGQVGVGVFFMITGFLFWGKLLDAKGRPDWKSLYIGRLWRIGPTYLLAVGLMFLVVAWKTGFELREPAGSVLGTMLQWLALGIWPLQPDINGHVGTGLILAGVTWTIFFEWLFYGALRPMAPIARSGRTPRFVAGGLLLCLLALTAAAFSPGATPNRPTIALLIGAVAWVLASFLLGMLSAWLVRRDGARRLPEWAASLLALACLVAVFIGFEHMVGPIQVLLLWGFFHLVCRGSTLFGLLDLRSARRMSTVSYSIYLLQGLALTVVFAAGPVREFAMAGAPQYWLTGTLCALLLVAASVVSYRLVERPGIAQGRRARSGPRRLPAAQAAPP
ncbi:MULTISPECIES: acyltransferase [unclassified Variovorax]|jgi:peptidoglycan/LPS O-acetylase OafA/YrhL|uniref:acyltransferase family protein n=1 Tax=unclassified Variovorax TaxID=663243 RepID=UPI000F7DFA7F|nr:MULTISPECIES: acyltransferase [unclassified Variovorax]RSZ38494.1 acyltransferase [Variovorax sp. 553]RSZ39055.1 acyltransferase [Variovorax sp. 679]